MNWFKKVLATFGDLFHSKKFLTAALGAASAIVGGAPVGVSILGAAGAYVLGQGLADQGKEAAKVTVVGNGVGQ